MKVDEKSAYKEHMCLQQSFVCTEQNLLQVCSFGYDCKLGDDCVIEDEHGNIPAQLFSNNCSFGICCTISD